MTKDDVVGSMTIKNDMNAGCTRWTVNYSAVLLTCCHVSEAVQNSTRLGRHLTGTVSSKSMKIFRYKTLVN